MKMTANSASTSMGLFQVTAPQLWVVVPHHVGFFTAMLWGNKCLRPITGRKWGMMMQRVCGTVLMTGVQ